MFTVDPNITDLKVREKNLFKVFFSMNVHQVAAPDMSLQEARSYVFFLREGRDRISSYIGLHFLHTDRKLFYTYSGNPFSDSQLPDVEGESRNFAEDLGAMLDEIDFGKMSDLERDRWIDEQEIFSGRKKSVDTPEAPAPAPAAEPAGSKSNQTEEPALVVQPMPVQQEAAPAAPVPKTAVPKPSPAAMEQTHSLPEADQSAPAPQQQPASPAVSPVEPAVESAVKQQSRPQRKAAASQRIAARPGPAALQAEADQAVPAERADDVLEKAVKAGIVKAPKAQLRKDIRGANGVVSRDKEALARLLSSF